MSNQARKNNVKGLTSHILIRIFAQTKGLFMKATVLTLFVAVVLLPPVHSQWTSFGPYGGYVFPVHER